MADHRPRVPLIAPESYDAPDGTRLSFRQVGEGRPLLLIHGFFSSGTANWLGHVSRLVSEGHRLVVPDLRAHGRSATPPAESGYPPDVLVGDMFALLAHLGIDDVDAAGYSLGARTITRMLVHGAPLRRVMLGGQGLDALQHGAGERAADLLGSEWFAAQWTRKSSAEQDALQALLASSVGTSLAQLRAISVPTLVVMGTDDNPADGRALSAALPNADYVTVPGDHVRAANRPEVAEALADFLDDGVY